jgi:dihydrofolate reductase
MRKIKAGLAISLDGVVEAPDRWHTPFNDEMGQVMGAGLAESDAVLLGRNTYVEFAGMWPNVGDEVPMAGFLNNVPKYVLSSTLKAPLDWANSQLYKGELAKVVAELKGMPGKNILMPGSPRLVRSLLAEGLLDELALMVSPVVVGPGMRLYEDLTGRIDLDLVDSRTFSNGVVYLSYRPRSA